MNDRELFDQLIRATGEAVWNWTFDGKLSWHDSPYSSTLGIAGLIGTTTVQAWARRLHPDDAGRVVEGLLRAREQPDCLWSDEYRLSRDDGGYATVVGRGCALVDGHGVPTKMVGTLRDVTAERDAQRKLQEAVDYTAALFHSLPGALYQVDEKLRLVRWNEARRDHRLLRRRVVAARRGQVVHTR